jgi:hypothetical protein
LKLLKVDHKEAPPLVFLELKIAPIPKDNHLLHLLVVKVANLCLHLAAIELLTEFILGKFNSEVIFVENRHYKLIYGELSTAFRVCTILPLYLPTSSVTSHIHDSIGLSCGLIQVETFPLKDRCNHEVAIDQEADGTENGDEAPADTRLGVTATLMIEFGLVLPN